MDRNKKNNDEIYTNVFDEARNHFYRDLPAFFESVILKTININY